MEAHKKEIELFYALWQPVIYLYKSSFHRAAMSPAFDRKSTGVYNGVYMIAMGIHADLSLT